MTEHDFKLPGLSLFGISEGRGTPVIMTHGITANAYVYAPIMEELGKDHLAVSIDQRGHGRSDAPAGDVYDATHYAQDILDLIDILDAGPAILIGHSLGCRNAMHAAMMAPEKVRFVLAVEYTPFIEPEVLDALEARVNGGARRFADLDETRAYLKDRYKLLPPDAIERRARYGYTETGDGFHPLADAAAMAATVVGLKAPLQETFEAVKVPVTVVRGSQSTLVSAAAFEKTQALVPHMASALVEGADHYVPEEAPERILALLRDGLAFT